MLNMLETAIRASEQLCHETVGDYQWRRFTKTGSFWVKSKHYRCYYRIALRQVITVYNEPNPLTNYINAICILPRHHEYPSYDLVTIQWLLCKYDEERLWMVGRSNGPPPALR